jgi:hypothetical protein
MHVPPAGGLHDPVRFVCTQSPLLMLQLSFVQGLLSSQFFPSHGFVMTHVPLLHVPPGQAVPFMRSGQAPVSMLQALQGLARQEALHIGVGMQEPSRQVPPGQVDPFEAWLHWRLLLLQLLQGPAQFWALQVPWQVPPLHIARLPVQVSGVQLGTQVPEPLQVPPGQASPLGLDVH